MVNASRNQVHRIRLRSANRALQKTLSNFRYHTFVLTEWQALLLEHETMRFGPYANISFENQAVWEKTGVDMGDSFNLNALSTIPL